MRLSTYSPNRISFSGSLPSPTRASARLRRRWSRMSSGRTSPAAPITKLETSFDPRKTLRKLRDHRWSLVDLQWLFCLVVTSFALWINTKFALWMKLSFVAVYSCLLLIPVTNQFWLNFCPIGTYLILFFSCGSIPSSWRPGIWVRLLPALENIFYGVNISNILSAHKFVVLDVLAWIPYGLCHFGGPFVVTALSFLFGPPGYAPTFARTFGYMSALGVITQLMFPCSPPWYENKFGLAPADYSMSGSPAGLARIDQLTGLDMYTSSFTSSPLVFGAFPSLHAGDSTLEALFMSMLFPKLAPLFGCYVAWMCWATMYLNHHYAVDLVGGALFAGTFFYVVRTNFLPQVQLDKFWRWDYEYVERGEPEESPCKAVGHLLRDEEERIGMLNEGEDDHELRPSKEWKAHGRSSSYDSNASMMHSPVDEDDRRYSSDAETLAEDDRRLPRF